MRDLLWSLLIGLVGAEAYAWAPRLAMRIVRFNASRLPPALAERMVEEWEDVLVSVPGSIAKLLFALDLGRAVPCLRHEFLYGGFPRRPLAYRAVTRLADIWISSASLLAFLPAMLLVAAAIKAGSPGPVLIAQSRCGVDGKLFRLLKFNWPKYEPVGQSRVASFLYRAAAAWIPTMLPALLNVLRGEMSLVGPPALRPEQVESLQDTERRVLSVRPGFVGLWVLQPPARRPAAGRPISILLPREIEFIERASLAEWAKVLRRPAINRLPLRR